MIRKILIGIALLIVIPVAALLAYHVATPGSGSVQMKAMKVALRAFGKVTDPPEHIAKLRTQPPAADPMPAAFSERYTVTSATLQGRQVVTLAPKTAPSRWHVIYTHGGAFVAPITGVHWSAIDEFSRRTGATITVHARRYARLERAAFLGTRDLETGSCATSRSTCPTGKHRSEQGCSIARRKRGR